VRVPRSQAIHDVSDTPTVRDAVAMVMPALRRVRRRLAANAIAGDSCESFGGGVFTVEPPLGCGSSVLRLVGLADAPSQGLSEPGSGAVYPITSCVLTSAPSSSAEQMKPALQKHVADERDLAPP
jgi:hypothetical protein